MNPNRLIQGIIGLFLVFVLLSALYPMIDVSATDLKDTLGNSTNEYVKRYLPNMVDYVPFLFILITLIVIILYIIETRER